MMLCLSICFLFGQHGTDSLFSYCTCSFAPEMCVCSITFAPGFYFCIFCFVTLWHYVKDIVNWHVFCCCDYLCRCWAYWLLTTVNLMLFLLVLCNWHPFFQCFGYCQHLSSNQEALIFITCLWHCTNTIIHDLSLIITYYNMSVY